jgi:hypothetical protein
MLRKESGTTRIKLPKQGTLYRLEGWTNPSFLYVVTHIGNTNIKVMTLRETGALIPCAIRKEIFKVLWMRNTVEVEDAKEHTKSALRGLI